MSILLTVIDGPNHGLAFSFDRHDTFVVGRSAEAGFRLPEEDPFVSRNHFLIEINPPACRMLDLQSQNGTTVNGERVTSADLKDGDEIRAGKTCFNVRLQKIADADLTTSIEPARPFATQANLEAIHERPIPPTIAGFRLDRIIGQGGMGTIYRSTVLADGSEVAVKIIKPLSEPASPTAVGRFLREMQLMRTLSHPHIVAFRESGQAGDLLYFTMAFVAGRNGAELLREDGPIGIGRAVRLTCQVLEALAYAHERKIVHRDVKPANVLVTGAGTDETALLTDFGLARAWHESPMCGLTVTGDIAGTPAYMPPEQVLKFRTVTAAGDQYSAGATLYNLLTGQPLFDCKQEAREIFKHILQKDPVPLKQRRPEIPARLAEIVHTALAGIPSDRFDDVSAFRDALLEFADA